MAAAIAEVERTHRLAIDGLCGRFASARYSAAALARVLRARLFGTPPKIADYAGQDPLESWLRVTAVRIFLELRR